MDPSTGRFVSVDPYAGDPQAPVSLHRYLYGNASPVTYSDPTGRFSYSLGGVLTAMAISSVINVTYGMFTGENTAAAITKNAVIGALEGAAGYGICGAAIKLFTRFGKFLKPKIIDDILIRVTKSGSNIPGTGLSTQMTIVTEEGSFLLSSGLQGDIATGAMKHVVNDILMKAGPAANTEIAEMLALKELEGALVLAGKQGIIQSQEMIYVTTSYAKWELRFELRDGVMKLFHAVPRILQ